MPATSRNIPSTFWFLLLGVLSAAVRTQADVSGVIRAANGTSYFRIETVSGLRLFRVKNESSSIRQCEFLGATNVLFSSRLT
jgi:hypothetical protein